MKSIQISKIDLNFIIIKKKLNNTSILLDKITFSIWILGIIHKMNNSMFNKILSENKSVAFLKLYTMRMMKINDNQRYVKSKIHDIPNYDKIKKIIPT